MTLKPSISCFTALSPDSTVTTMNSKYSTSVSTVTQDVTGIEMTTQRSTFSTTQESTENTSRGLTQDINQISTEITTRSSLDIATQDTAGYTTLGTTGQSPYTLPPVPSMLVYI